MVFVEIFQPRRPKYLSACHSVVSRRRYYSRWQPPPPPPSLAFLFLSHFLFTITTKTYIVLSFTFNFHPLSLPLIKLLGNVCHKHIHWKAQCIAMHRGKILNIKSQSSDCCQKVWFPICRLLRGGPGPVKALIDCSNTSNGSNRLLPKNLISYLQTSARRTWA